MIQNVNLGLRLLFRHWGSSMAIIAIIGLTQGAAAVIFSFGSAVLEGLPYPNQDRLVAIYETTLSDDRASFRANTYALFQGMPPSFESIAALRYGGGGTLRGGDQPERALGVYVTAGFFETLGVQPLIGRCFRERENPSSVILSHSLWVRRFRSDPSIIGRPLHLDGEQITPVAVLRESFWFSNRQIELWRPLRFTPEQLADQSRGTLTVIGRLAPTVTPKSAEVQTRQWLERLVKDRKGARAQHGIRVELLAESVNRQMRPIVKMLAWSVALLFLIACGNITGLLLARAQLRGREFAVRVALGCRARALVSQILTETLILGGLGCVLGLALAWIGSRLLLGIIPESYQDAIAGIESTQVNAKAVLFSIALMLLTTCVVSLVPAIRVSRTDVQTALRSNGRGVTRRAFGVEAVVALQLALSLLLLMGTGVLVKELLRLRSVDVGFQGDQVLTMRLFLSDNYEQGEKLGQYQREVARKVGALPGIEGVAFINYLPLAESGAIPFRVNDREEQFSGNLLVVSPLAFSTLHIPLHQGRDFADRDGEHAQPVAIMNSSLARACWPDGRAIGRRILMPGANKASLEIVGVVGDVKSRLDDRPMPTVYLPFRQKPAGTVLLIRSRNEPTNNTAAILREMWSVDRDQPVRWIGTLGQFDREGLWQRDLSAIVVALLAGIAVVLAVLGMYGVMASYVLQRIPEIGVRMALGATARGVQGLVLARASIIAGAGLALGAVLVYPVSAGVNHLLFGANFADFWLLSVFAAFFFAVALGASYLPSRRATTADPLSSLRFE